MVNEPVELLKTQPTFDVLFVTAPVIVTEPVEPLSTRLGQDAFE
jgi:hypothetical protein